jgi:hypothetical protein
MKVYIVDITGAVSDEEVGCVEITKGSAPHQPKEYIQIGYL